MNPIVEQAAKWGIETAYTDGLGRDRRVEPSVLAQILEAMGDGRRTPPRSSETAEAADVTAFQGRASLPPRAWGIAVQLYGVRSRRNWGHGDFTDLSNLIDLASELGAATLGLNPLHALFDDRPDEASPYFPSSRLFLNPMYIDIEAIPECPAQVVKDACPTIDRLRGGKFVDYPGVATLKANALPLTFQAFRDNATDERRRQFKDFQNRCGPLLNAFAAFEVLRRQFDAPWWQWPVEFRKPDTRVLQDVRARHADQADYFAFVQWIAHEQLSACRDKARRLGLPIGLYLDVAVGVRADGFDAWSNQTYILPALEIGAPPDPLNTQGQCWGLAGVNPAHLIETGCEPYRQVLRASMQYAGAIRIDHILGLKRFYLIPRGLRADQGAYVRFPFEALLTAASQESLAHECIVIGEDLGTVPAGFQDTLARFGIWSFQVLMFQRAPDGGFIAPDHYRKNALVTFSTHDLPTFAGWILGHDMSVKRNLGHDPGETDSDRADAKQALARSMAWHGLPTLDLLSVTRFLADTPSRLLMVNMEDAVGELDQVNVPGTINEHPNWRRRLPVMLEDLATASTLPSVATVMDATGRRSVGTPR